jgi:alanine dehydrogenase
MNIGIPKEKRPFEFRVGMTPAGVQLLCKAGHTCYVEHDAGLSAGFSDQEYQQAGAKIAYSGHEVFGRADLLLKVTRPLFEELEWLRPETIIAGLLHLGSAREDKIDLMLEKKITSLAYEQITLPDGTNPVRRPLSQIGGRLVPQIAAKLLQSDAGGKGVLLGGIAGVPPAEVVIIGSGLMGTCAAKSFLAMGAHVTVLDINPKALQEVIDQNCSAATLISNPVNIARTVCYADVVVGSVLVPGEHAPIVVTREMVRSMKPRSIIMDVSIDEGGCVETSHPTTHEHPTFIEEGVVHYCVPNIPSAVARTSTYAFINVAFPYILEIANEGIETAMSNVPAIRFGIGTYKGEAHVARFTLSR